MIKWIGIIILGALMIGSASGATLTVNTSGGANYTRIQDAINNASAGDTILVQSGTYYENVDVNKLLILKGVDTGGGKPVVDGGGISAAIMLHVDEINLEGFTATNSRTGIQVISSNNILSGNNASNNIYTGIYAFGSNNTLIGNIASNNNGYFSSDGIELYSSSNNTLSSNIVWNNKLYGVHLYNSSNNILSSNIVSNNTWGIELQSSNDNMLSNNNANSSSGAGIALDSSSNNMLIGNTVSTSNYGIFLGSSSNNTLSGNNAYSSYGISGPAGIYLQLSNNNTLVNNNASNNMGVGIFLFWNSSNNTLSGNIANSNKYQGISLEYNSNNNTLKTNTASNNNQGIYVEGNNHNMLSNNTVNSNNNYGIILDLSDSNIISDNTINSNNIGISLGLYSGSNSNTIEGNIVLSNNVGILLQSSSNNNFMYNNYFNNTNDFSGTFYANYWNTTKTSGTNIIGGPYLGGNFWGKPDGTGFSQTCADVNRDGICDSAYALGANNTDYLPLSLNFTTTTPYASTIGYSALVATGQNTFVQSSNGTFGLLLKGQSKTINNSVILNNTGDISAKVEARFNDSIGGVFGLVSVANALNATNFALGIPSSLVPLNNSGANVQVAVAPPGVTAMDARLGVPNEQAAGDYSGTVILTFSNNV